MSVTYKTDLNDVDWAEMKATLRQDKFDNGRTPEQLKTSFENSYATCIAYSDLQIIGTARVLSDGICNAYLVDIWTLSTFRRQGIAQTMVKILLSQLQGQHVYLFTISTEPDINLKLIISNLLKFIYRHEFFSWQTKLS